MIRDLAQRHTPGTPALRIRDIVQEVHELKWKSLVAKLDGAPRANEPDTQTLSPKVASNSQTTVSPIVIHQAKGTSRPHSLQPESTPESVDPQAHASSEASQVSVQPCTSPQVSLQSLQASPPLHSQHSSVEAPAKRPSAEPTHPGKRAITKLIKPHDKVKISAPVLGPQVPFATKVIMPIDAVWKAHWQWFAHKHS